jgi:predicted TIM-barrel fold metal-dependent hydrolase
MSQSVPTIEPLQSSAGKVMMISSDCHASPRTDVYVDFLERRYLPELERYLAERGNWMRDLRTVRRGEQSEEEAHRQNEQRMLFATELDKRLTANECDGIVAEVLFPDGAANNAIPFSGLLGGPGGYPVELHSAALRAYNRWLSETATPDRQVGLALIPLHDPRYAAEQVKAARNVIVRGVMLRWDGTDPAYPPLSSEELDPVWDACAANDLAVHFHFGDGVPKAYGRYETLTNPALTAEIEFWCRRPLWHFISGGVLQRHPDLKLVFTECRLDWIPRTLAWLDWLWAQGRQRAKLPRPPSEYWHTNCYMGATIPSLTEQRLRHELGLEHFMYGTDFPHVMSPWGISTEFLQATLPTTGYTAAEARAVLGENAARFYDFDVALLQPIVDRVGPDINDLLNPTPLTDPLTVIEKKNPGMSGQVDRPPSML